MIIYLDDSICEKLEGQLTEHEISSLEDLASVVRAGSHMIVGGLNVLRLLSAEENLGIAARAAFRSLLNKFSQLQSAVEAVSIYAKIVGSGNDLGCDLDENKKVLVIPLALVRFINLRSPLEILFEEINDKAIYEVISRWYVRSCLSPGFINRQYRAVHGGGGRTYAIYADIQERNDTLCLCITDSDKKFPNDEPGPTSTKVREVSRSDRVLSSHLDLDFHEIENLVPFDYLGRVCTSPSSGRVINIIRSAKAAGYPEARLFWDFKKGFKLRDLKSDQQKWDYWSAALELGEIECRDECSEERCSCTVIEAWPEKRVIKDKIQEIEEMDPSECGVLKCLWEDIGSALVSWSAATVPKIA